MDIVLIILVSAFIGAFTNYLAIKMLFKPQKPWYLFKKRVPFTPGIIPKNRVRIANSLAETIEEKFLNEKIIKENLKFDFEMDNFIKSLEKFIPEETVLKDFLHVKLTDEKIEEFKRYISNRFGDFLLQKFEEQNFYEKITKSILKSLGSGLGILGGLLGNLNLTLQDKLTEYVKTEGIEEIKKMLLSEISKIEDKEIHAITGKLAANFSHIIDNFYVTVMSLFTDFILSKIDIREIVEKEINDLDINEFEKVLIKIINKELKAITYLGGVLGGIIGIINIFIK